MELSIAVVATVRRTPLRRRELMVLMMSGSRDRIGGGRPVAQHEAQRTSVVYRSRKSLTKVTGVRMSPSTLQNTWDSSYDQR
jgi:hypothetical protein